MLFICGVGEDSWESLGLQGDPTSPSERISVLGVPRRTDVEGETPIIWPPDVKNWLTLKYPDAGKDWGQEEKGTTEDEMVGWHHRHNGCGFGCTLGVDDGQRGLVCCSPWGCKESDTTYWLNNHNKKKSTVKAVKKRAQIVWLHLHEILEKAN